MMAGGAFRARPLIIRTKRSNRQGLVVSALVHVGILAGALLFARATPPQEAIPPDAMQVAIITPQEMPRYSGTPSTLRTSGSERAAQAQAPTMTREQPPTVPQPRQDQRQEPRQDQRQAQRNTPPKPQDQQQEQRPPQTAPPQAKDPPLPPADQAQMAAAQPAPDPPSPATAQTADASDAAATAAYLALAGGRLGGGFAAPPINSPLVGYDFTEPFREVVSSCGASSPGFDPDEKISIVVRVFLDRDGSLAAPPQLLEPNPTARQQALMQDFVGGLQKCQPYTMLPPDRYMQWKTLDLVVRPHMSLAQ
jgi:hypothetical protein